jgi:hypothetical protein
MERMQTNCFWLIKLQEGTSCGVSAAIENEGTEGIPGVDTAEGVLPVWLVAVPHPNNVTGTSIAKAFVLKSFIAGPPVKCSCSPL